MGVSVVRVRLIWLIGAAAVALLALALPPLGATTASASHPCGQSADGSSPPYDSNVWSDHDACMSPPSPQPGDVVLREGDAGATVTVPVGGRLFVQLTAGWTARLWTDITGGSALHRTRFDLQRPSTTAVFVPGRVSDGEQVVATDGPSPWSATVVVAASDPSASPSPATCRRIPWNGPGTLSDGDDGRTVTVARGDVVVVAFPGCTGVDYQPATAEGPLRRYRASGGNPGAARSIFSAATTGTATVTAESDAACLHTSPACAMAQRAWRVTVQVVEPCVLTADPTTGAGTDVTMYGRFAPGATVQVWFRPYGGTSFTARRTLTADQGGRVQTSYRALADQRWYATSSQGCTTAVGLTRAVPWIDGPVEVRRGTTVRLVVHGPAGQPVQVWFLRAGQGWVLRRSGRLDAAGVYPTSYLGDVDHRWYAVTGPDHRRSGIGRTVVR